MLNLLCGYGQCGENVKKNYVGKLWKTITWGKVWKNCEKNSVGKMWKTITWENCGNFVKRILWKECGKEYCEKSVEKKCGKQ